MINRASSIKENILILPQVLIILLPAFLISGALLTDLAVSICAIFFFLYYKEKLIQKIIYSKKFIFFIFFYLLLLIASIFAEDKFLSLKNAFFYFRFGLFSIFFYFLISKDIKILGKIFISLLFCYLCLFVDGIYQFFNGQNLFNVKIILDNRVSSFFGDELIMGSYLARLYPLVIGLYSIVYFKYKHIKFQNILFFFFTFFTLILVLMSGERTGFFFMIFSLFLILIFFNNFRKEKIMILISIAVLFLILLSNTRLNDRVINRTLTIDNVEKKINIFTAAHEKIFRTGFYIFINNPIIGVGPKNFRVACKKKIYDTSEFSCTNHPHNTYLQLLSETGIIGFLIVFFVMLFITFLLIKSLYLRMRYNQFFLNNLQISLLICLTISLFPLSPSGSFFNNWLSSIYYYPVGILIWSFTNKTNYLKK
jgi:O-antigen ligase